MAVAGIRVHVELVAPQTLERSMAKPNASSTNDGRRARLENLRRRENRHRCNGLATSAKPCLAEGTDPRRQEEANRRTIDKERRNLK